MPSHRHHFPSVLLTVKFHQVGLAHNCDGLQVLSSRVLQSTTEEQGCGLGDSEAGADKGAQLTGGWQYPHLIGNHSVGYIPYWYCMYLPR
jgi:hypothetical protein